MPKVERPKLVNRGGTGLLEKLTPEQRKGIRYREGADKSVKEVENRINNINPALKQFIVPIDSLKPDPMNARVHNERNTLATMESLKRYGQVTPISVRKKDRVVLAGNGRLEAAKRLGWTKIAVTLVDFDHVNAAGYALADNRTAELAKWDFQVVASVDKLLQDHNHPTIGWSDDEVDVLRTADFFVPPPVSDEEFGGTQGRSVKFLPEQVEELDPVLERYRTLVGNKKMKDNEAIVGIALRWGKLLKAPK